MKLKNEVVGIGVLLRTNNGAYLFQERDHSTDKSPGQVAPFGGGLEEGEDVLACAQRELNEELTLKVDTRDLRDLGVFESHNRRGSYIQMYQVNNVDKSALQLNEGKSIVELSVKEALRHPKVTDFTKEILQSL